MASHFSCITDEQAALIRNASLFFVATADPKLEKGANGLGPVNVSPKGGVPLHLLGPNRVAFLDYKGSGNETARHCISGGPITLMICSFEASDAAIVRLYGRAKVTPLAESPIAEQLLREKAASHKVWPPRDIIDVAVETTMTSCGYGVPVMTFVRDRRDIDRGRRYKPARA
jgi:hypothetical protein